MGSETAWLHNRLLKRLISLFPEEKRGGIWLTAGLWYLRYFRFMRIITLGLYGRPMKKQDPTANPKVTELPKPQQNEAQGFAPLPPSQFDQRLSYEEWMEESIHFFRNIGFFEEFRGLDDVEVLNRLHEKREAALHETWDRIDWDEDSEDMWILETRTASGGSSTTLHGDPAAYPGSIRYADYMRRQREDALERIPIDRMFDRKNDLQDLWIAMEDGTRVHYGDLEVGAGPDSEDYAQALTRWGRISRGVFDPKDISEAWTDIGDGLFHVTISFQWNGTRQAIEFDTPEEWLNLAALEAVNRLIRDTGIQLHTYASFDQCAYIVSLTSEEKAALEQKRGWKFSP